MTAEYLPSSGYYRRAIRTARTHAALESIAYSLVRETEFLRTWARANGLRPPHFEVTNAEAADKGSVVILIDDAVSQSHVGHDGPDVPLAAGQ